MDKLKTGFLVVLVGMIVAGMAISGVTGYKYTASCKHTSTNWFGTEVYDGEEGYAYCDVYQENGNTWRWHIDSSIDDEITGTFYSASFGVQAKGYDGYLNECCSCYNGYNVAWGFGGYNRNCGYHECMAACG
ncbi:MAG: hypothetical protein CVT88_06300 [Candidatus Altiarchaeales archaeon HGW-Altiarchaeales-1]|nr:MAG: hypothetical protein CVT88_06300 [Candidatus Altiarchaeales archaeon HGW-Altiarchaeales-1]